MLTIYAATGGVDRHLLGQAVTAGHDIPATVRSPRTLPGVVRVVIADLMALATVSGPPNMFQLIVTEAFQQRPN
jgi:putative NADH-flavin reductase